MNFAIYLLSFISSAAIIMSAPNALLKSYLSTYAVASAIFSLAVFLVFSYCARIDVVRWCALVFGSISAAALVFVDAYAVALIAYPCVLIFSDYLASQSYGNKVVNYYRVFLLLTSLPFFVAPDDFVRNIIIRVLLVFFIISALLVGAKSVRKILVKSPVRYLICNYAFYNGVLVALTYAGTTDEALKLWFISTQAGLVLLLKYLDFSLRRVSSGDVRTARVVAMCSLATPVPCMLIYPSLLNVVIYITGFLGLMHARKYVGQRDN